MSDPRVETLAEKHRIEQMVTGILTNDAIAQAVAAEGLDVPVERMLRAAGGIIAGLFTALGPAMHMTPIQAWSTHMQHTTRSRND